MHIALCFRQLLLTITFFLSFCDSPLISKEKINVNDFAILDDTTVLPNITISEENAALKDAYIHALASLIFFLDICLFTNEQTLNRLAKA